MGIRKASSQSLRVLTGEQFGATPYESGHTVPGWLGSITRHTSRVTANRRQHDAGAGQAQPGDGWARSCI
ncbi:MAG: hypothetical protein NTU41_10010 [Chloroflexi bacterium]|nr:hypothetical protein [Chloroflexota bacterium]